MKNKNALVPAELAPKLIKRKKKITLVLLSVTAALCTAATLYAHTSGTDILEKYAEGCCGYIKEIYERTTGKAEESKTEKTPLSLTEQTNKSEAAEKPLPFYNACLPIDAPLNSGFGYGTDPITGKTLLHRGVDIKAAEGTEVKCALKGTVTETGEDDIGGKYIRIAHEEGFVTYYGHLSRICVKEGDTVDTAQKIALSGSTGSAKEPHLHFQIERNGRYINPEVYFAFKEN